MFTITENILLWEGVYNNREYFTLGGCCGPERLIQAERTSYNKSFLENISLWEGVCGPERPIHTDRESQLQ